MEGVDRFRGEREPFSRFRVLRRSEEKEHNRSLEDHQSSSSTGTLRGASRGRPFSETVCFLLSRQ